MQQRDRDPAVAVKNHRIEGVLHIQQHPRGGANPLNLSTEKPTGWEF